MTQILIIGAGQLGSRHLQALGLIKKPLNIAVVDPSKESLNISQTRFEEVDGSSAHTVSYYTSVPDDIGPCEIAIVASNSVVRKKIVTELLRVTRVKFLILEKFLFQRLDDYEIVLNMLNESETVCYVNCPKRIFKGYMSIKNEISNLNTAKEFFFKMDIEGMNWGLGCNSIHFLDLFHYFVGVTPKSWESFLDEGYLESKRNGYIEFSGLISANDKNHHLSIFSGKGAQRNVSIRITTNEFRAVIMEDLGKMWIEKLDNDEWTTEVRDFQVEYQSQLTNIIVEDLLDDGTCGLTPYKLSSELHKDLLRLFMAHYNKSIAEKSNICPIT